MNTNELMIGNLCQDKISGALLKVTGLKENDISFYVIDRNLFPLQPGWQAEPIPLTEEWLLKFGFEKVNNELTNIAPLNLPCTFNLPNTPFSFCQGKLILTTSTGDFCVNTEYVHQLQNLYFTLTGEELKLKEDESKTD
jgi:hypothetical protein